MPADGRRDLIRRLKVKTLNMSLVPMHSTIWLAKETDTINSLIRLVQNSKPFLMRSVSQQSPELALHGAHICGSNIHAYLISNRTDDV